MPISERIDALLHPFSYPHENLTVNVEKWLKRGQTSAGNVKKSEPKSPQTTFINAAVVPMETIISTKKLVSSKHQAAPSIDGGRWTDCEATSESEDAGSTTFDSDASSSAHENEQENQCCALYLTSDNEEWQLSQEEDLSSLKSNDQITIVQKTTPDAHFQNSFFTIAQSSIAGWGAFATRRLRRGDVILRERPLFIANWLNIFREFASLEQHVKEVVMSLYAHDAVKPGTPKLEAIWITNCFATSYDSTAGLFPIAARFNHACHPKRNVTYGYDAETNALELVVSAECVAAGEELTISYGDRRTPADLFLWYGFRCRCGACRGLTEEEASALLNQW